MIVIKRFFYFLVALFIALVISIKIFDMNVNDIVLRTLSKIKQVTNNKTDFHSFEDGNTKPISHEIWDGLLKKYIKADGMVDYKNFKNDRTALKEYLNLISNNPPNPKHWNKQETIAYWINAYNAFRVDLILEHYPLISIKDTAGSIPMVNSPWDLKFFKIGGIDFDLNTIEHEILRKMDEPRIHFAINCASGSCPVLRNEAYTSEKLETQLAEQTADFINDARRNVISDSDLQLSQIFDWFKVDFEEEGSVLEFIEKYGMVDLPDGVEATYLDYDWSLNE